MGVDTGLLRPSHGAALVTVTTLNPFVLMRARASKGTEGAWTKQQQASGFAVKHRAVIGGVKMTSTPVDF